MTGTALALLPATVASELPTSAALANPPRSERAEPARRIRRATLAPGDRVGAWRIDAEIGRGGMGSVYAVTHQGFGKRAALKLCHASILGESFTAETFLREARIVHRVDHPGVVDVFATGAYRGRPYLVMERLAGETLGERLDRTSDHASDRGALPRTEAIDHLIEVCDVLGAAHAAGVVHRDLKLDNVFVLAAPGAGGRRTKLLDWGVARILGEEPDPMRGMIAGTLTYVAPEQIRGEELGPAADVYSLAVLAYQLLLGGPPFTASSGYDLLRLHLRAAPPLPAERWPEIPAELAATLAAMLAKDPAERPPVTEVRHVLELARAELAAPARTGAARAWLESVRSWLACLAVGF